MPLLAARQWWGFFGLLLCLLQTSSASQLRALDLLPYLTDSPPTTQVAIQLCNVFGVVEKPYYILFGSCWVCALLQQLIDATRYYEERLEELGKCQKCYVGAQLLTLVLETYELFIKVDWLDGASVWSMYNLYVYVFVHSSIFVRSIMMSMIIWDWKLAKLLKRPIFGPGVDGRGWSDVQRAVLLVFILQLGSSAFVMAVVIVTHVAPALFLYYPVFAVAVAFIIQIRAWLTFFGINPDGRVGRGLVMAGNSFVAVTALQTLITSMIRVYVGEMAENGYLVPIKDDFASRHISIWFECHLSQGWAAFQDQDFLNLFIR